MAAAPRPAPYRFQRIGADHAPGQEQSQVARGLRHVDFSHGDVSAFPPPPEVVDAVTSAMRDGGRYAYSPYRGHPFIRDLVGQRLSAFTGAPIDPGSEVIVTPGTQGGLFLALSALVERGDEVAVVAPDYFANRKIVEYLEATPVPVDLAYRTRGDEAARLDLDRLRTVFRAGARLLVFSNPNNPTGAVYTADDIEEIARLAAEFDAFVVVDQLYSRQVFDQRPFTHLRAHARERCLTLVGPSKTESVSGCRVGVAVAPPEIVDRMEQLQGIVSLRAAGYMQAALEPWFVEAEGWLDQRIIDHARIRDDLHAVFGASADLGTRLTEGGSYLFLEVPAAKGRIDEFVRQLRTEAAVTVTRGPEFGDFPAAVRLNFSQDHQAAVDAARRIVDVAARW
ncbi:pyridoxal phosphate-dependent aminotransferase [Streptomyces oceani]|uniref:Aspartate aminotransferase n=1 Tax=Streptomyces oceani TaxID=1075402 RepID=A0A1E7JVT5_9ACTN|nr:pyridoxal phosphate-dependent aminotransferase [Streptomyces oceani]OEU94827.1 aspartate aminotransferase [Streptomyces oceani]